MGSTELDMPSTLKSPSDLIWIGRNTWFVKTQSCWLMIKMKFYEALELDYKQCINCCWYEGSELPTTSRAGSLTESHTLVLWGGFSWIMSLFQGAGSLTESHTRSTWYNLSLLYTNYQIVSATNYSTINGWSTNHWTNRRLETRAAGPLPEEMILYNWNEYLFSTYFIEFQL